MMGWDLPKEPPRLPAEQARDREIERAAEFERKRMEEYIAAIRDPEYGRR